MDISQKEKRKGPKPHSFFELKEKKMLKLITSYNFGKKKLDVYFYFLVFMNILKTMCDN